MVVNGATVTSGTGTATLHGADVSAAQIIDDSAFWKDATNGPGFDPAVWDIQAGKLPTLSDVGGDQSGQIPAYIVGLEGDGDSTKPYKITSVADLQCMRDKVNAGDATYTSAHYLLTTDLDLSGLEWTPIGSGTSKFKGSFDGADHVARGLTIQNTTGDDQGLFGYIDGGTVKNLGLEDVRIDVGSSYVGGVAGWVDVDGSVENCYVTGSISGGGHVGGVAGYVDVGGSVENCYATGAISGGSAVGGIAGYVDDGGSVENCYATGAVSGGSAVGGIAGYVDDGGSVENCYATGAVSGGSAVGGIAGRVAGSVTKSVALNSRVAATGSNVGRVAGYLDTGALERNYAFKGMELINALGTVPVPSPGDATTIHGADVSGRNALSADFWQDSTDGPGFEPTIWTLEDRYLPELKNVGGSQRDTGGLYLGLFPLLEGTVDISGSAVYNEVLTAGTPVLTAFPYEAALGDVTFTWYRDDVEIGSGESYTLTAKDVGKMITLRVTTEHTSYWVEAVSDPVEKADGPAAPTDLGSEPASPDSQDGKITGLDPALAYEYRPAGADTYTPVFSNATEITGLASGDYEVRLAETATHKAGTAALVTVEQRYSVTVEDAGAGSGTAAANPTTPIPGETVTLTVTPAEDYYFDGWKSSPTSLAQSITGSGDTYTFTMPEENITVTPYFNSSACAVLEVITPESAIINGTAITADVPNDTGSVTVALTVSLDATWQLYHDVGCTDEITDQTMTLTIGANTAYVRVTAMDGLTTQDYSLTITRAAGDACEVLEVITPGSAIINGTAITADVPNGTVSVTVALTVSPDATWKLYRDESCTDEITDQTMPLTVGANTAYVRVTAMDGLTTQDYSLTITRAAGDACEVLEVITPESAIINGTAITADVPNGTGSVTVALTVSPDATWKLYRDEGCTDEITDQSMPLIVGANTAYVRVTAMDGTIKDYTLTVTRAGSSGGSSSSGGSTYTVTFHSNGGSSVSTQRVSYNGTVKKPADPTREGYAFTGWYTDTDLTAEYDFTAKVAKAFTLYAGWEEATEPDEPIYEHPAYISGYSDGSFWPENSLTRAEAATLFYNLIDHSVSAGSHVPAFSDITSGAWYCEAVMELAGRGVINGYADGTFKPDETITRAEFVTMALCFARLDVSEGASGFSDVAESHWAAMYIARAVAADYVSGYPDGSFRPDGIVSRAEAVTILNRVIGCDGLSEGNTFSDVPETHWSYEAVTGAATGHDHK